MDYEPGTYPFSSSHTEPPPPFPNEAVIKPAKNSKVITVKRGDICYANLDPCLGSEQGGRRPVLILQNNTGNRFSPTTIVAAMTTQPNKTELPTHVHIPSGVANLPSDTIVMLEQIRTLDKKRLIRKVGHLGPDYMKSVDTAAKISLTL